jgi:uncharacterized damage-inducible protein DinB
VDTLLLIGKLEGFSPHIAALAGMMDYTRYTTLDAVKNLSVAQLDFRPPGLQNSIGMLLAHMAAVEVDYQVATFEARALNPEELERWGPGLDLGSENAAVLSGQPLEHYLETLEKVREKTLLELAKRDDTWLLEPSPAPEEWGGDWNPYFQWFHVMEDELNHRGQIRLIRKLLPS